METMMKQRAAVAASVLALAAWGCDDGVGPAGGGVGEPEPGETAVGSPRRVIERPVAWPIEEPANPGFVESSGDSPVGAMGGGWRASTADANDAPLVYFDFTHAGDDAAPECTYLMAAGADPLLKGQYGRCSRASWAPGRASIDFNPTNDGSEMWTLTLTESQGEWRGRLTTHKSELGMDAVMRRRDLAPESIPAAPPNAVDRP